MRTGLVRGLMIIYLAYSIGAIINIKTAFMLCQLSVPWWFIGLMGATVGTFWTYSISKTFTWKRIRN